MNLSFYFDNKNWTVASLAKLSNEDPRTAVFKHGALRFAGVRMGIRGILNLNRSGDTVIDWDTVLCDDECIIEQTETIIRELLNTCTTKERAACHFFNRQYLKLLMDYTEDSSNKPHAKNISLEITRRIFNEIELRF